MVERKEEERCIRCGVLSTWLISARELIGLRGVSIVDKKAIKKQIVSRRQNVKNMHWKVVVIVASDV